jgi:peptidoglycan/LPS O-acetylase OafA/YrhL
MVVGKMHVGSAIVGIAAVVLCSIAAAACVYLWFERPTTRLLRAKLLARDAGKPAPAAVAEVRASAG